jgi:polyisoprenoid-binding protein YceI
MSRLMQAKKKVVLLCLGAAIAIATAVSMLKQPSTEPARSTLGFAGVQAGARFEGEFRKFVADIDFDPEHLAQSHFDVTIDMQSVDSKDEDRDTTMRGPDLFAASTFPTAHYVANTFSDEGNGRYRAAGKLTLRDVTREIPLEFTYEKNESGAWIKGGATLERLDFGVGQGDWQGTTMVANEVEVRFAIKVDMSDDVS